MLIYKIRAKPFDVLIIIRIELDDFDQDMIIGNAASERQKKNTVVSGVLMTEILPLVLLVMIWRLMKVR